MDVPLITAILIPTNANMLKETAKMETNAPKILVISSKDVYLLQLLVMITTLAQSTAVRLILAVLSRLRKLMTKMHAPKITATSILESFIMIKSLVMITILALKILAPQRVDVSTKKSTLKLSIEKTQTNARSSFALSIRVSIPNLSTVTTKIFAPLILAIPEPENASINMLPARIQINVP
jgi:hypothetical protein